MIRYLTHKEIDRSRWDACISAAENRRVYAFSWYLDIVSPGWEALVEEDYHAVMPLTVKSRLGIRYLYQPYFAQQLGVFSGDHADTVRMQAFLSAVPIHFRHVDIHLNHANILQDEDNGISSRINCELPLSATYDDIFRGYSQNCRRNLRKAADHGVKPIAAAGIDSLVALFRENYGRKEGKLGDEHYRTLIRLLQECTVRCGGKVEAASATSETPEAAAFMLPDNGRWYFLFAASSMEARKNGAMFYLADRFISLHAGQPVILDFEGGNDLQLRRFYAGFGASEVPYGVLSYSRLPAAARGAVSIVRKLRKY